MVMFMHFQHFITPTLLLAKCDVFVCNLRLSSEILKVVIFIALSRCLTGIL